MTMGPKTFRVSEVSKVTRARLRSKTDKKHCKCFQEKKNLVHGCQIFLKLFFGKIEKKKKNRKKHHSQNVSGHNYW